jgi:hypothetical protein
MPNLAYELKKKRDAEVRLRQLDSSKNITINASGGAVNPANALTHTTHDALDHTGLTGVPAAEAFTEAVHDTHDHDGLPGVGNAFVVRQNYVNTDTIVVAHALGVRPIVQVIGGAGPGYGEGVYDAGEYGGSLESAVVAPSSIVHDTVNQVTVTLASADTGEVVCIG